MLQTSARLLRLLTLLQSRRHWSGAGLAEALEVTERTVRRDVDRLRSLGYPVQAAAGVAGGYRLAAGAALPPLQLEDDEALAVALGLRAASGGTVTGVEEAALRALTKLEQVLPARLRRRVNALHHHVVSLPNAGPQVDVAILSILAGACRERQRVRFTYASPPRRGDVRRHTEGDIGMKSVRTCEPLGVVRTAARWYLVAWDVDRDDWRTFRVDRVEGRVTTGETFLPREPPDRDLARYVSRSVSSSAYPAQASLLLHAPLAAMAERIPPSAGVLERVDAQRCRLQCGAASLDWIVMWVAVLGVEFEAESPPELVERMRTIGALLTRGAKRRAK